MDLRDAIQRIALKWPSYGRPRITAELKRQGWKVGPNRVRRLMREDNLLCVRKRKFVVTTDSNHGRKVYPNLAGAMELSGINQLWVADITYIRLETEFVYLAVVIDAFSRRVIGWALDRTLEDDLPLAALRMAFEQRQPASGLVHHSDRGSQYASHDYTDLLKARGCQISMSHKASPWENGGCESWMKTLKYEEVFRQEYRDLAEARTCLERFIEKVYNQQRLHSALGYRPPVEFDVGFSRAQPPGERACSESAIDQRTRHSGGGGKGAHNRETLQTTGFYVGRIVIVSREFAPIPHAPAGLPRQFRWPSECVFSGMTESIGPMWSKPQPNPGAGPLTASRRSAPSPGKRTRREDHALLIVRDEFRPAIPRSGWSPPEPVSASPTRPA